MSSAIADIGLLVEGSYGRRGVHDWVHPLIAGLPRVSFALLCLGESAGGALDLPSNVVYLHHYDLAPLPAGRGGVWPRVRIPDQTPPLASAPRGEASFLDGAERLRECADLHEPLRQDRTPPADLLGPVLRGLGVPGGLTEAVFARSAGAWEQICAAYRRRGADLPFADYFAAVHEVHGALFRLAELAATVPVARAYHATAAGYAGLLGAILRHQRGARLILTEHGPPELDDAPDLDRDLGGVGGRFFRGLRRLSYAAADPIIALHEGLRLRQIQDGAEPARAHIIPAGIDLDRFAALRARRPEGVPRVLGLIGPLVPSQDAKTFLRALRVLCDRVPDVEGWLIGSADEDPGYARACRELASSLGLRDRARFLAPAAPEEILPRLGLLVQTALREESPRALLEALASGVPVVATDIGACRQIIEGQAGADRDLGSAGGLAPVADAAALSFEVELLLSDERRWYLAQQAGARRIERYYAQPEILRRYAEIYERATGRSAPTAISRKEVRP